MEQDGLHGARPCAYVVLPSSYAIDDAGRTPHEGPREASIITEEINQAACPLFLSNVSIHVHTSRLERTYLRLERTYFASRAYVQLLPCRGRISPAQKTNFSGRERGSQDKQIVGHNI